MGNSNKPAADAGPVNEGTALDTARDGDAEQRASHGAVRQTAHRILGEKRGQFLFNFLDGAHVIKSWPDRGDPLWSYFEFQRILTIFWFLVCFLQMVPMALAGATGVWHKSRLGAYHSLFIDSWGPREGHWDGENKDSDERFKIVRYAWYFANGLTLLLATLLPSYVRSLSDWKKSYPSVRHLMESGALIIRVRGKDDQALESGAGAEIDAQANNQRRLQQIESIFGGKDGKVAIDFGITIEEDDNPDDRDFLVTIKADTMSQVDGIKNRLKEHIEMVEVQTKEDFDYVARQKAQLEGRNRCCGCCSPWLWAQVKRRGFQFLNLAVFVGLITGGVKFVWYLTDRKAEHADKDNSTVMYVLIALTLTVLKVVFEKVSGILGGLAFGTHAQLRESVTFVQRLLFKATILIISLIIIKPGWVEGQTCREAVLGGTLLIYMAIDYAVGWLLQFVIPILLNCLKTIGGIPPAEEREKMLLHEEYLDIAYNQLVLYIAVPIFPGAAVLGLFFSIVEGKIDHWKIERGFVGKPDGHAAETQIAVVATTLNILLIAALAAPEIGIMTVLHGVQSEGGHQNWGNCTFP